MKWLSIPLLAAAALLAPETTRAGDGITYVAYLSGDQELTIPDTPGSGYAVVTLSADMTTFTFEVSFQDLVAPATVAHIHFGPPGVEGPILFDIDAMMPRDTEGYWCDFVNADDFVPSSDVPTFDDAIAEFLKGNTYVNIHSLQYRGGEIRGQLYPPE